MYIQFRINTDGVFIKQETYTYVAFWLRLPGILSLFHFAGLTNLFFILEN